MWVGPYYPWWRHQMETFSALLAICAGNSPVPGEFHTQRPVTRSFDVYFDLRPNKRLSKQLWGWWFETPSWSLWRHCNVPSELWVGDGGFSKAVATLTMWAGHFYLFMATTGDVWIMPSFGIWGLCAVCWAHFMCHHELWPTSVGHLFSFLNSYWGLTGGKHYQKIIIAIFRFVLQNFTIPCYLPYILFYSCLFYLLSSGWFVIAAYGSISVQGTSYGLVSL